MGHAPSPFGASSASHAEAHKGSLFSCSLGQALSYCWSTVHREVIQKALTAFTLWTFTTQSLGTAGLLCLQTTQLGHEDC